MNNLTRRDFLKLASIVPIASFQSQANSIFSFREQPLQKPNVIIILYDAMSAHHLSLYGYPRKTTPNLERFAEKATVFHAHYSTANFTTPGVASLLTGTYPWKHRSFQVASLLEKELEEKSIFSFIGDDYFRSAYTQNQLDDLILYQLSRNIDEHHNSGIFSISDDSFYNKRFSKDPYISFLSLDHFLFNRFDTPGSVLFSQLQEYRYSVKSKKMSRQFVEKYPKGIPGIPPYNAFFLFEDITDGVIDILENMPTTSLTFFHFFPPHDPYLPRKEFIGIFDDGWIPIQKDLHILSTGESSEDINNLRRDYDEYIVHTDSEFGRLFDHLDKNGFRENSYIIVTSDHGELFERGVHGHVTPLLFDPLLRIPLLISKPGQTTREDIRVRTSSVDIVPTILHQLGRPIPDGLDGCILPGFGGIADPSRKIFAIEAKSNPVNRPITKTTIAMFRNQYKLIYYLGYRGYEKAYELYDLSNDPEEIFDISRTHQKVALELLDTLKTELQLVNLPYEKGTINS